MGVVCVGFTGGTNWYSDGSILLKNNKYYPAGTWNGTPCYYDYDDHYIKRWNIPNWENVVYDASPFDQVPPSFLEYLKTNDFELH